MIRALRLRLRLLRLLLAALQVLRPSNCYYLLLATTAYYSLRLHTLAYSWMPMHGGNIEFQGAA